MTKEFMPSGATFPTGDIVENAGNGQGKSGPMPLGRKDDYIPQHERSVQRPNP